MKRIDRGRRCQNGRMPPEPYNANVRKWPVAIRAQRSVTGDRAEQDDHEPRSVSMAAFTRRQDDRRLPPRQRSRHQEGVREIRRAVPTDGAADKGERGDRRVEVRAAQKNIRRKPVAIELPVLPALQAIIDASPTRDLAYVLTGLGKAFTPAGFGNWFSERCNQAGLVHCSAHGLRKAGASIAAENGASPHQLMAIFGWLTLKEAERYTQAARRRRMARNFPAD